MEQEPLSKKEFAYIRQQEKSEALIAILEAKLLNKESENVELVKKAEVLTLENDQLKADLEETTEECQKYVDDIEAQNDEVQKENDKLKGKNTSQETEKEKQELTPEPSFTDRLFKRNKNGTQTNIQKSPDAVSEKADSKKGS